jgi:kynureninase
MQYENSLSFAQKADKEDVLSHFRDRFHIPVSNGKESIYFTGHSLGLQPKTTAAYLLKELDDWAKLGVDGHFHATIPWYAYHEVFVNNIAAIVGAQAEEVIVMNQLSVNLHLMMTSFYRPTATRYKIICEASAFPSDQYAFQSQVRLHGFHPNDAIVEVKPREGEYALRTEDILLAIEENTDSVALVLFGGVNYFTGQVFNMDTIAKAAHDAGAYVGFDLAHAIGNIPLKMHDWNVDFACWCSYKYLNSGPGGVGGAFIHQRHVTNASLPRLAGWWGHDKQSRFKMEHDFKPIPTAEGWQLSNAPVLSMAAHRASIDIFAEAGMDRLVAKSRKLTGFLAFLLKDINSRTENIELDIITPLHEEEHGCQLSVRMSENGRAIFEALQRKGVITDWREPNVKRIAPVPLYNSFEEVWRFGTILEAILNEMYAVPLAKVGH